MKLLTDTHALVWALDAPGELSPPVFAAVTEHSFTASMISFWELVIKQNKSGALVRDPVAWWDKFVVLPGIPILTIDLKHIRELAKLPDFHKDPFDRLLVAQAIADGFTIITKDAQLARYNVPVIW